MMAYNVQLLAQRCPSLIDTSWVRGVLPFLMQVSPNALMRTKIARQNDRQMLIMNFTELFPCTLVDCRLLEIEE